MTIPEEIEQLKLKLENTANEREQAEVLMEILKKYSSIKSTDSQLYIDRLLQLAEKLNEPLYEAWALCSLAVLKRNKGEFDDSIQLSEEALALFKQLNEKPGIADAFRNIAIAYNNLYNYSGGLKNHLSALKIFEEIGDKSGIAKSHLEIGVGFLHQDDYEEALKNYFICLRISQEIGLKSVSATCNLDISNCYRKLGDYVSALTHLFAALKVVEEIQDKELFLLAHCNLGFTFYDQGNYADALKNHSIVLKKSEENGDNYYISLSYTGIGLCHFKMGNYTEAHKCHSSALSVNIEIGSKYGMSVCYNNLGNICFEKGDYQQALSNYLESLKLEEEGGYKFGVVYTYNKIGDVYEKEGNFMEACKNQLLSAKMGEEIGAKPEIKEAYLSLTRIYKATHDFEDALKYHEKYHQVEGELLGEQAQKQLTNLNFMHNMEQKEKDLEIEQLRNVELKKERDRSETLLLNILPAEVAEELKNKGTADAKLFDDVTVLFTDFKGFTNVSERLTPQQLVDELNVCFSVFDEIMAKHNIEKIKTVGDAYLAVSGLPLANANHAMDVINAAIEIREFIKERVTLLGDNTFDIRIGVHSGSVVAGIVGIKKFAYDIWGDTVNTAARMEQNSEAGKINISHTTYELVKDKFTCEYRGEIEAKNKGKMRMYFVES